MLNNRASSDDLLVSVVRLLYPASSYKLLLSVVHMVAACYLLLWEGNVD